MQLLSLSACKKEYKNNNDKEEETKEKLNLTVDGIVIISKQSLMKQR